jgi:excisionase family DNA binding protein
MNYDDHAGTAKSMSVPAAGARYLGLSRGASYQAAASGLIPTIRVGRLLKVPIAAMERLLESACRPRDGHKELWKQL